MRSEEQSPMNGMKYSSSTDIASSTMWTQKEHTINQKAGLEDGKASLNVRPLNLYNCFPRTAVLWNHANQGSSELTFSLYVLLRSDPEDKCR
ncbi:hypothetical protein STEG23_032131, partial [Scotinomys teguina]